MLYKFYKIKTLSNYATDKSESQSNKKERYAPQQLDGWRLSELQMRERLNYLLLTDLPDTSL